MEGSKEIRSVMHRYPPLCTWFITPTVMPLCTLYKGVRRNAHYARYSGQYGDLQQGCLLRLFRRYAASLRLQMALGTAPPKPLKI